MIYLDNAATTKVDDEVLAEMMPYLKDQYGNAGTIYGLGREANKAVELARERVAEFLGTTPEHIVFTSGGSEANSMVFYGFGWRRVIISEIEHDSIQNAAKDLVWRHGMKYIDYVSPNRDGVIEHEDVERKISGDTNLVSVMYANNETGVENEVCDIRRKPWNFLHVDAVQAAGSVPLKVEKIGCDFLSISGHKIHAPKGVGALYMRPTHFLHPLIYGGDDQEFGKRGGTENVAGIVGLGKACSLLTDEKIEEIGERILEMKQLFYKELKKSQIGGLHVNGPSSLTNRQKTLNVRFDGVDAETLILMLDAKGIYVSAGSACRSKESKPSYVLKAMGLTDEQARSSIRVSFSKYNTTGEVVTAAREIANCVKTLREGI